MHNLLPTSQHCLCEIKDLQQHKLIHNKIQLSVLDKRLSNILTHLSISTAACIFFMIYVIIGYIYFFPYALQ